MSDLDGLVPWFHEQLNTREKRAREAAEAVDGTAWSSLDGGGVAASGPRGVTVALGPDGYMAPAVEDHIAAHDPARVLRAIAAKRVVIKLHAPVILRGGGGAAYFDTTTVCTSCEAPKQFPEHAWPCPTLRALAAEYADQPGYKETWRP